MPTLLGKDGWDGMPGLRLSLMASHGGSNLQAIIAASASGQLDAVPHVVISNNGDAPALTRARDAGIPAYHLSRRTHPESDALDTAILQVLVTQGD